jgi:uncharacterized Tic20 family protein
MANANEVPETPQSPQPGPAEPQGPANVPPAVEPPARETDKDARMWAMFCHLAGLAGFAVPVIGFVIGPLVVWLIKKDQYPFVDEQGKEAVNFQITMLIIGLVLSLTCILTVLVPAALLIDVILLVIAAIKANDGYHYRYPYPLIIRFVK